MISNDNIRVEQLIAKKMDLAAILIRFIAIAACIILLYMGLILLGPWGLALGFFIIYFVYYVFKMTSVEYELLLVNNELTVDAIYGKDKRKSLAFYDVKQAEMFAPMNSDRVHNYLLNNRIASADYTSGYDDNEIYVLIINTGANMTKIFFEPNEKLFEGIKTYIPRKTFTE